MSAWDAGHLPHVLQNAIHSNDIPTIRRHLPTTQRNLDGALFLAMQHSAIPTIEFLLEAGAALIASTFFRAIDRQDTAVFEVFLQRGWRVADTPGECTAVQ